LKDSTSSPPSDPGIVSDRDPGLKRLPPVLGVAVAMLHSFVSDHAGEIRPLVDGQEARWRLVTILSGLLRGLLHLTMWNNKWGWGSILLCVL
jgi:hypothetical protein